MSNKTKYLTTFVCFVLLLGTTFQPQNKMFSPIWMWGDVFTDIVQHIPNQDRYKKALDEYLTDGDIVTAAHELTHYLNEYLGLKAPVGYSAYYVLKNRVYEIKDPEKLRGKVVPVQPCLRGDLYKLYFETNAGNAKINPLYLLDEWTAYINDTEVAVDQLEHTANKVLNTKYKSTQPKTAGNVLEFTIYGIALGKYVKEVDPDYYNSDDGDKLCLFIKESVKRAMAIHKKAVKHKELNTDDSRNKDLLKAFRDSDLKAYAKELGIKL